MENFLHQNSLYVVLGVSILLWLGFIAYMFFIDRKVNDLENKFAKQSIQNEDL